MKKSAPTPAPLDGSDQRAVRLAKLEAFRARGINPYPERFEGTVTSAAAAALPDDTEGVRIAGRLMSWRDMGKLTFAQLQDRAGRMQLALREEVLGKEWYRFLLKHLDMGDLVGAEGKVFTTKTGERTLEVTALTLLAKALLPLPEKWHGLTDIETRYRKRYLDLLVNDEARAVFRARTQTIRAIRNYLDAHAFEEVETPILQITAGGALAKPFSTHHNALDLDVALRIAPETYLKRLIVGGYERVYEFARCFRNEGMDPSHLQEFTMLEYYVAWWNFEDNMDFTEALVRHTLQEVSGTLQVKFGGADIDFAQPWPRREFMTLIQEETGIDPHALKSTDELRAAAKAKGIVLDMEPSTSLPNAIDVLYKKAVRPKLVQPQFLIRHPADLKPLARRNDADPTIADSFQLLVNGWEIVNAYSELVDPIGQRQAFEFQAAAKVAGDDEAMAAEEDYLEAMEHGMPPMSGWGMGIDRFVALLTNQDSLRDTIFFPLMKPDTAPEAPVAKAVPEVTPITHLAYLEDMQRVEFSSAVTVVRTLDDGRAAVVLEETYFYPQGGGQPYDQGRLDQWKVEDVRYVAGEVLHIGAAPVTFAVGDAVHGSIDPVRRALHTRLHAAGHVVDLSLARLGIGWKPGKGYHFPEGPYVEYLGSLDGRDAKELAAEIEAACNAIIAEDLPVTIAFTGDSGPHGKPGREVRYGETGIRCGGTHVTHLGEIGPMTIRKVKKEKDAIRVAYDVAR